MKYQQRFPLQAHNTFGLEVFAEKFVEVKNEEALENVLKEKPSKIFILGGGSNILLTRDIDGLVIKNGIKGRRVVREFKHRVHVEVGGGENWHQFVLWCIRKGYGGIENLSLIPGTVGAAPIQNIGAYGVELKDVFLKLNAFEIKTCKRKTFLRKDCDFGYRDSVFKRYLKGKYFITCVYLSLSKNPKINISYGAIQNTLKELKVKRVNIKSVSKAVINIRQSKLPDPAKIGNAGSFFKNPEISSRKFKTIQKIYPQAPHYPLPDGKIKVPAGWLIEQCGWKGKRIGNTGSHSQQALVLVNYGGAKGKEILLLAQRIIKSVEKKFGIKLRAEVNVI